jgi:hypothetical protein
MMQRIYPHHAALGNRVGLHYSRFWPKLKTPAFINQILSSLKKSQNPRFPARIRELGLTERLALVV